MLFFLVMSSFKIYSLSYFQINDVCAYSSSCVLLFTTPWTVACQAPLPMGFSRQYYWSELPCPSPGDPPDPEIEPRSPVQADSLPSKSPGKPPNLPYSFINHGLHTVCNVLRTYLLCNWKFVPWDAINFPPYLPFFPSGNHQPSVSRSFDFFRFHI